MIHTPVLLDEVLDYLRPEPGKHYIDATAGSGGHAIAIINAIRPLDPARGRPGKLLALERDEELFRELQKQLTTACGSSSKHCISRRTSYTEIESTVRSLRFGPVAGVLFDFGLSSFHLEASRRGFSFRRDEMLDMRYSRKDLAETAADILARRSQDELERILKEFGEEPFARAIAREIVRERRHRPIKRTGELAAVVERATPRWYRQRRIHSATRTFQALRIAVNHEFENIPRGLDEARSVLAADGRIVTIAFHYREDALVKQFFRQPEIRARFMLLTERPVRADPAEVAANPRSRSALLRAYRKLP